MNTLSIQPLSPLDGRYRAAVSDLGFHLSEAGLNRARIAVEIEWLIHLANRNLLGTNTPINEAQIAQLRAIVTNFSDADVAKAKLLQFATDEVLDSLHIVLGGCLGFGQGGNIGV